MLKPRFKNWYLAESYLLGGGSFVLILAMLIFWFINAHEIISILISIGKLHLSISVLLMVSTFVFEFVYNYKRACK